MAPTQEPLPALAAMRRSIIEAVPIATAAQVLARRALQAHFQPIVRLRDGSVFGHESLIRGPEGSRLRPPLALFAAARDEGLRIELEQACLREGIRAWTVHGTGQRLFVNLSADSVVRVLDDGTLNATLALLKSAELSPSALVVELTEHDQVADLDSLLAAAAQLRAHGVQFALDDFGDGHCSLRLWAELRPEIVKIDRYFIHGVHAAADKVQTLRALTRFAESFGTRLVAEGIECAEELQVLRDLGLEYGQGFFLGRPAEQPATAICDAAAAVVASAEIAVLPEVARNSRADFTVERLAMAAPTVGPTTPIDEVARIFAADELLRALAVVDHGRPIGLIDRQTFVHRYAKPYFKELYGRKSCLLFASTSPLILDKHTGLETLTGVLTSADQRYLTEGFVITEAGRYLGLGTGEQLVRVVTELRIEAARHANPLTFLPGNIPISEHIARLLASGGEFVACYADLNDFKPFNDHYGYWRGDEMIRLVARTLIAHCDPRRDFVGHVGGDDFVVLFQSEDWYERCERIIEVFNDKARGLFDEEAAARGGIEAEDRHGVQRFFRCTTLSIGAVRVRPGCMSVPEEVASAAAAAKHRAKLSGPGLVVEAA